MKFKDFYLREKYLKNIKLITEIENPLVIWGTKIAKILDVDFQGLWDRSGMEKIFPNEILQFTDSRGQTKTTFTVDYIDGMSFDDLLDKTEIKLKSKIKDFSSKKSLVSEQNKGTNFIGVCDKVRKCPEGEEFWQRMMKDKKEISEREFLRNVDIYPILDDDESWEDFKYNHSDDKITFYKSLGDTYFFQIAGFEFIWRR
ncbi:MAG: hypothetical protein ACOC33_02150 [bacterium]